MTSNRKPYGVAGFPVKVLFIVHATAWSDKGSSAKEPIQRLISESDFDRIIEIIQARGDIKDKRYLSHDGLVLEHEEISPVPFLAQRLFGEDPIFPVADSVTLVGGVFNSSGGCLNVAFEYLVRHHKMISRPCEITIPVSATYRAQGEPWQDAFQVEQCVKDLAWRVLSAGIAFGLEMDGSERLCRGEDPLIRIRIKGIGNPPPRGREPRPGR